MAGSGGLRYYLTLDTGGFSRGARAAEGDLTRLQRSAGASFSAMKLGGLAAAAAIGTTLAAGIRTGYQEMQEAQKVGAQTAAVIKSTGGAAGVTRKQVEDLAGSLQGLTGVEDDAIQSGANVLLTFTKIGKETFPAATRAALDLSVAFGKDMSSASLMVGKALQDPINGVSALTRVGVSFTQQQKDQIKAMVEAGRTADAQKLILGELNKQVGGSGAAFGKTLPGQIERAKRAWEDITQQIMMELLPAFTDMVTFVNRNMPKIRAAIQGVSDTVRGVVRFVRAIIAQDWSQAWALARTAVVRSLQAIAPALRRLGGWLLDAAKDAGRSIARGIWAGFEATLSAIPGSGALRRVLGMSSGDIDQGRVRSVISPGGGIPTRAMGGWIPGTYDARDDVPALLSRGEVVLNPRQAQLVGVSRINSALAATGGVMGGHAFARGGVAGCGCAACRGGRYASGGWVYPAVGASKGGGPGGGTHSRSENGYRWQDDDAYDLMGRDGTPVIAPHDGVISATRPFNSDSRYWGMAAYLNVPGGQFYLKHMKSLAVRAGQRVSAGQVIGYLGTGVNGGPHLHIAANPLSLLYKAVGGARVAAGATDGGHLTPESDVKGAPPPGLTRGQAQAQARGLMRGGRATGPGLTDIASIDARHEDDEVQDRAAKAAGIPESRILMRQKQELEQDVTDLTDQISRLNGQIGTLRRTRARYRTEMVAKGTKAARRLRLKEAIAGINDRLTELLDAVRSLEQEKRQILRQMVLLGYDIQDAQAEESSSGADSSGPSAPLVGADGTAKAALPEAQRAYSASRTEFAFGATGAGDIGSGGRTAWDAIWAPAGMPVNVTVQAIHPGDPYVLDQVGRVVVASLQGRSSTPATSYMSGA